MFPLSILNIKFNYSATILDINEDYPLKRGEAIAFLIGIYLII